MSTDQKKSLNYLSKHAFLPKIIVSPPRPNLAIAVVIPCYNEPEIIPSLLSLFKCEKPNKGSVEILVVINSSETDSEKITEQNKKTITEIESVKTTDCPEWIQIHIITADKLPSKHAGVGLARKIGMDEAVRRFLYSKNRNGIITGFDADSLCESNYFTAIERYFSENPACPAASIHFEHPLNGLLGSDIYTGITQYELHLRYYIQALRFAEFPFAFHTIGSSFVVRSETYCSQGGMNRRQAGEDFYFLHKVIPLGNYGEINETKIIPSPRASNRVPFGTGRAINEFLDSSSKEIVTYHPNIFVELKSWIKLIPEFWEMSDEQIEKCIEKLLPATIEFLKNADIYHRIKEIKSNSASFKTYQLRFFRWFDGFMVLKFVHYLRDHAFGELKINEAASQLLGFVRPNLNLTSETEAESLLGFYRKLDQEEYLVYKRFTHSSS